MERKIQPTARAAGKPVRMRLFEVENGRSFEEIVRIRRRERYSDMETAAAMGISMKTFYRWARFTELYDIDPETGWLIPPAERRPAGRRRRRGG